jgi:mRNA-degrading endonuclease RelE of RelBE toxin-antitoxin system
MDEVDQDLKKIDDEIERKLLSSIFELEDEPLPDNSYVIHLLDGTQIQCLKLQEEDRNSEMNHRVTYDIDGDTVKIYGVFCRESGYLNIKERTEDRR